jgi:divinyl chlorophyllide a 8-vinyl-reductase
MTTEAVQQSPAPSRRALLAGASGYMGQHVASELLSRGYRLVCLVREPASAAAREALTALVKRLPGAEFRVCDVTDASALLADGLQGEHFDVVVSCLAARGGGIKDAWLVDHQANLNLLAAARQARAAQFLLLSAICVQKPQLAFQHAKLAFEQALQNSGLDYCIVRPTAFFKSLAGQVARVQAGKPFLVFGDGQLTACKPIAEEDLATYMVDCIEDPHRSRQVLPVGGPGPAITPLEQGRLLFELSGRQPRFRHVPVRLFDAVIAGLSGLSGLAPGLRDKAEFARIGRYYATESMLWLDPQSGRYDAHATPAFGSVTLRDFYTRVLEQGLGGQELGEQAMFK